MTVMDFPSSPVNGQTTTDGRYYFDSSVGSTGAWRSAPLPVGGLPAGSIMAWGTNTPPANWLLADGAAVSRSTYSSLFAVIGTQYGTGNGTTTFNLPDLRGRIPVGKNGGTFGTLGATGGAETHTLTTEQMPSHTHIQNAHTHVIRSADGGYQPFAINKAVGGSSYFNLSSSGVTNNTAVVYNDLTTATNQAEGGGAAHNNLQPYQVVNYVIKASAGWTAGDSELATRLGVVEANQILSPNYLLNGAFDISQRGTSITGIQSDNTYTADRWYVARGGALNYSQGTSAPPTGFYNYGSFVNNGASNPFIAMYQTLETRDSIALVGKTVTLSFYARANANTSASKNFLARGLYSTTVDAKVNTVISSLSFSAPYGTTSSDWTRYSHTFTVPASAKTVGVAFQSTETLAVGDGLQVTGVQLELGSVATPFRRNATSVQAELAACQRYFWRWNGIAGDSLASVNFWITDRAWGAMTFPVTMRATPSINWSGTWHVLAANSNMLLSSVGAANSTVNGFGLDVQTSGGIGTMNIGGTVRVNVVSGTSYVQATAEL